MSDVQNGDAKTPETLVDKKEKAFNPRGKSWFLDEKNGIAVNLSEVAIIDMRKKQLLLKSGKTLSVKDGVLANQTEVLTKLFA